MRNILLTAAASLFIFGCSNDNENSPEIPEQGVVFEISTVNKTKEGLDSRTRPLYGQDALQEVERVNIYAFKKNTSDGNYYYNKTLTVDSWPKGSAFQRYSVPTNQELSAGDYQFLVVGQELTDNYTLTTPTVNTTQISDISASVSTPGKASEIFAGQKNATVEQTGGQKPGVRVSVEMTRQVAGVLGYFKNVPNILNNTVVKYLQITVTNANKQVYLANGNGATPTGATDTLLKVDLSGQTVTSQGVYAGNDLSSQGVAKVENSQLFGKFAIPVSSVSMTVALCDASGNVLKTWTVTDGNNTTFNISPNHFYSLGRKVSQSDLTGGGTPDPGDDDAPIDLLQDQVIAITINANWDTIHNLVIQ